MSKHQPTVFNQIFCLVKNHLLPLVGQLNKLGRVFDGESLMKVLFAQSTGKESLRDIETSLRINN